MELLLNFLWLTVSLALIFVWASAVWHGHTKNAVRALVALSLLIALLLPIISITDDLFALDDNSLEYEQHTVRRPNETPLLHLTHDIAIPLDTIFLAVLLILGFAVLLARLSRFPLRPSFIRKAMEGFVRAAGVRPPPMALLAA
ncbi:MAG TPA: hypothetical protein VGB69_07890 [Edaphobacter sp.]